MLKDLFGSILADGVTLTQSEIAGKHGDICFKITSQSIPSDELLKKVRSLNFIQNASIEGGFLNVFLDSNIGTLKILEALDKPDEKVEHKGNAYVDYIGPNMKTNMNLGIIRNAFLGDFVANVLSKQYQNVRRGPTHCDTGQRADIMMYMRSLHPDTDVSFYDLYKRYLEIFKKQANELGIPTELSSEVDGHIENRKITISFDKQVPICQSIIKFNQRLNPQKRSEIVQQFTNSFLNDLRRLHINIQEHHYHSTYQKNSKNYLDLDKAMIASLCSQEGIDNLYYVFGQDQENHSKKLLSDIKERLPNIQFHTISHRNVYGNEDNSSEFKDREVFSVLKQIKKQNNCSDGLALFHLKKTYLSIPMTQQILWSKKFENKLLNIQGSRQLVDFLNESNMPTLNKEEAFSETDKLLILCGLKLQNGFQNGIQNMRPDLIINSLDSFVSRVLSIFGKNSIHPTVLPVLQKKVRGILSVLNLDVPQKDNCPSLEKTLSYTQINQRISR